MVALFLTIPDHNVKSNVAKAGGLQSQGAEGEAVIIYCEPLATLDLKFSGFPGTGKQCSKKEGRCC